MVLSLPNHYLRSVCADLDALVDEATPQFRDSSEVQAWKRTNFSRVLSQADRIRPAFALALPTFWGTLRGVVTRLDGTIEDYGVMSLRVVTTVGVGFIVDAWQNSVELETMKYHGLGTGTNAESSGDTALQTELTTAYNPDNTRATGSLGEGVSGNIFQTTATNTLDGTAAVTEHGIFSNATVGSGVLFDRSVFGVLSLSPGDSLATTYSYTLAAGG